LADTSPIVRVGSKKIKVIQYLKSHIPQQNFSEWKPAGSTKELVAY